MAARTTHNRWVNFEAPEALIGQFVQVQITEALANSFRGRWLPDGVNTLESGQEPRLIA